MLECLRPGDRTVLGHVAHQDHRDALALGELHEPEGRFPDLADAARRTVKFLDRNCLDRIDDQESGTRGAGHLGDPPDLAVRKDGDGTARDAIGQAEPNGSQSNLRRALLAGDVEDRSRRARSPWRVPRRPAAGGSTCRRPARRRGGPETRGPDRHRGRGRVRRSPPGRGRRAALRRGTAAWRRPPLPSRNPPGARLGDPGGSPSRRGCSSHRRSGTALPIEGSRRHTPDRHSGFRSGPPDA